MLTLRGEHFYLWGGPPGRALGNVTKRWLGLRVPLEYASSRTGGSAPDPARSLPPALTVPDDNDRESAD